jgi:hypothetical protein
MAEDTPKVKKSSKHSKKSKKRSNRNDEKPVNGNKRQKLEETKEQTKSTKPSAHRSAKNNYERTAQESNQTGRNVSTKNGNVCKLSKSHTSSSMSDLINIKNSIKEPKMKVLPTVEDKKIKGRKSLRLKRRGNNLEECKGCTCKKSQCIKLYCE